MSLQIIPVSLRTAQEFVAEHHRHHRPPSGHKFSIGVADDEQLVGVAVVGRPISRVLAAERPWTLEVLRTATDGTRNANSALYGAAWRAARGDGLRASDHVHAGGRERILPAGGRLHGPGGASRSRRMGHAVAAACGSRHERRRPDALGACIMSAPSRALCALVDDREGFACLRCGRSLLVVSGSRHHRVRRRDGGHTASNLILVCGSGTTGCHAWMHANPRAARALGYIIPATWSGLDTEIVPVFSRTRGWMQLKDEGAPVPVLEAVALELLATFGLVA